MSVQVYGCNHVAIEVGDIEKAVAFYEDVFGLQKLDEGEGDAFFKLGEHQFLAMFERRGMPRVEGHQHFGIMVRDEAQQAYLTRKETFQDYPPEDEIAPLIDLLDLQPMCARCFEELADEIANRT
jgi:catechol 2,3-dioxygenase-like lactoylglutathione lyase family enzyme